MTGTNVLVVGSGASAVHFAASALERGHRVTMVDVGHDRVPDATPPVTFTALKDELDDPVRWFLGTDWNGVVLPDRDREYYGFPPSKQYVFQAPSGWAMRSRGFEPLLSFARGGLGETWTGGCYPYDDGDLEAFPFTGGDLLPRYTRVAGRIGISGAVDDLARFLPVHDGLLPPLRLDPASQLLLEAYARRKSHLNAIHRAWVGRSRVATLPGESGGRSGCRYLNRCLWGCPVGALWTPRQELERLRRHDTFRYLPHHEATHFTMAPDGSARALACRHADGSVSELTADRFVLAAGTLGSAAIFLRSWRAATGHAPVLSGLMDNRQVLVPFLQWRMVGRPVDEHAYQYHLVGMGLEGDQPGDYVHAQVTTLKGALLHPFLQRLPFDLRTSVAVGRATLGGLGVVNVNFRDTRRPDCTVTLDGDTLRLRYVPPSDERSRLAPALRRMRRVLRVLGCFVPPGLQHVRPMGASAHYAGLFPMSPDRVPFGTDASGRSWDVPNLWFADGSTFPFLPAKNITFTLMANAVRIAEEAF